MLTNCTALAVSGVAGAGGAVVLDASVRTALQLAHIFVRELLGSAQHLADIFVRLLLCFFVFCNQTQTEAFGDEEFFDAEESQEWLPRADPVELELEAPVVRVYCTTFGQTGLWLM